MVSLSNSSLLRTLISIFPLISFTRNFDLKVRRVKSMTATLFLVGCVRSTTTGGINIFQEKINGSLVLHKEKSSEKMRAKR